MNRQDAKAPRAPEPDAALDALARQVVDAALAVHRELGPGLLESVYEHCLTYELEQRGIAVRRQVQVPVRYRGIQLDAGLRIDLIADDRLVVEVKAVEGLQPVHDAQLLTYLKLSGHGLGLLINFNVPLIKNGIRRLIRPG